ncbi:MAG: hypothetical protein ACKOA2_01890 [Ilumatobacteraceae bacterium]
MRRSKHKHVHPGTHGATPADDASGDATPTVDDDPTVPGFVAPRASADTPVADGTPGLPSLAATIAGVIERQLSDYLASVAARMEGFRNETAQHGLELRADLQRQLDVVVERLDLIELRAAKMTPYYDTRADHEAVLGELREQVATAGATASAALDRLTEDVRRIDTQAADLVQHVNDLTIDLAQQIDHGDQRVVRAVEERLATVRTAIEAVAPGVRQVVDERLTVADARLTSLEQQLTDAVSRSSAVEQQVGETVARSQSTDATITRLEGIVEQLRADVAKVDESALDGLKEQLSSAVGEAMLVRIELDRAMADTAERLDKSNLRMAEIESMLGDELDVSAAVQLERLDEIERALAELDPGRAGEFTSPEPSDAGPSTSGGPNDGYPLIGGLD